MKGHAFVLGFLVALTPLIAACGEDDPMAPEDDDTPAGRQILDSPSFATNIVEIFNRTGCSAGQCHGNGLAGLTLSDAATSYANLVGIPAANCTGETRVIAGDATNSYLMKKVQGTQACGNRMPPGGQLDNIDIGNLTNWINQGAQNN